MVNFKQLQTLYNSQMDLLLGQDGLTTKVEFNFGANKTLCPNCIFDPNLKKSSNKYKTGGPVPFDTGRLCPYCNGVGYDVDTKLSVGYLAIIWDYKKWINPPKTIAIPEGMIQTICNKTYLWDIRQCQDMSVIYPSSTNKPHKFVLYGEPNPAGLGDNNYIISMWQKAN